MADVRFACRCLAALGILLLVLGPTSSASAQTGRQPDLEQLVLASAPAGFEPAPPGTPNTGRLTPKDLPRLGTGAPEEVPPGSEAFLRQWVKPSTGDRLVILVVRLPSEDFADEFLQGATRAVQRAGTVSRFSTGFPDSFGFDLTTPGGRAVIVAGSKGVHGYTVSLSNTAGEPRDPGSDIPIDLARQQRNLLPEVQSFSGQDAAEDVAGGLGGDHGDVVGPDRNRHRRHRGRAGEPTSGRVSDRCRAGVSAWLVPGPVRS